jgi:hypothetical protein
MLRWLMEVTQSPESLDVDGPDFVSTIRVRLRHAAVHQRMLDVPSSHTAFFNSALYGHTDQHVPLHPHLEFFCCNPVWKQLPRLGAHLTTQQAEDLVALFRFLAYLVGAPTGCFSSAARAKDYGRHQRWKYRT